MMGLKPMMGLKLMDPKFSGDIGSVSEVFKSTFLESVFWGQFFRGFLGVFFWAIKKTKKPKTPKSLKGFGPTVRRVWVECGINGGAEFASN